MNVGSLFSGIGGLDLGLERAGMRIVWQVECDPYARAVLRKHWPDVPCYEDVREVGAANLAPVDLICGGFPCQDISNAGRMAGIDGERSGLWAEFARIIREIRPRYALVENVAALLARGLDRVLRDLAESGYDAEWDCIPARAVGAPHNRDRLFVIAYAASVGQARPRPRWQPCCAEALHFREADQLVASFQGKDLPFVCRGHDGISEGMDRLPGLGNAVVPQVAEYIGRLILAHAEGSQMTTDCPTASEQAPLPYRESRQAKGEGR